MFISAFLSPYDELFNIKQNFKMKKYMPLNGLRWSRDSGSALCGTPPTDVLGQAGGGRLCHKLLSWIGKNSMEVYILHVFFVMVFKKVGIFMMSLDSPITIVTFQIVYSFMLSLIAITLSVITSWFLKENKIIKLLLFGL